MLQSSPKILYVEDDQIDQMAFTLYVKSQNLNLDYKFASSVFEAKNLLKQEAFDIVIADYSLGDGNAFEIFDHVTNKAPIIFVTSANDLNLAVKALKTGAYDYLVKDLERNYLGLLPLVIKKAIAHKKAEEELIKAKIQVEESLKIKEQFLANMSHEIRTPVAAIVGFAELIAKTSLTKEQKEYIDAMDRSGKNLLLIINDILDFSKNKSGKINIESVDFKLSQVLSLVHTMLKPNAVEKNIKLNYAIASDISDDLVGDPTRLNQILINLVGNAIKFTEKGEVRTEITKESETKEFIELKIAVIDTGIGIPAEKLGSVFELFVQATSETTRKYGGTGLGLAIVKQLVELQNGTITVQSELRKGSSFSFILKYKRGGINKTDVDHIGSISKEKNNLEGLNVLVVEDNVLNQLLAQKNLKELKCNVVLAENGLVAIKKLEEQKFDLVLMDIQLPEMDGIETTIHIRNKMNLKNNTLPIFAVTAHAIESEKVKCLKAGMNDYITKPIDWNLLNEKTGSLLDHDKIVS